MEKKEVKTLFAVKLLEYRTKNGWSQATLAEKIVMDEETVRRWEKGETYPNKYAQQKLREVFNATSEELGLNENPRLKRIPSASPVNIVPTVSGNGNGGSPLQETSTQTQAEMHNVTGPYLSSLRRKKWPMLLTFGLVLALCFFALWKGNVFQGSLSAHQSVSSQTPPPSSPVYYSFEDGIEGWFFDGPILSLQSSSDYAKQGNHSLKVIFRSPDGQYPFIEVVPLPTEPLSSGQTVSMYVYVPATFPAISVQPFIIEGSNWVTTPKAIFISPGTWTKVSYTVPASVRDAAKVGIQLGTNPANVKSTIYVDAVGWR